MFHHSYLVIIMIFNISFITVTTFDNSNDKNSNFDINYTTNNNIGSNISIIDCKMDMIIMMIIIIIL